MFAAANMQTADEEEEETEWEQISQCVEEMGELGVSGSWAEG